MDIKPRLPKVIFSIFFSLLTLVCIETLAFSQSSNENLGVGFIVGDPTGITASYVYNKNKEVTVALGLIENHFQLNLDHHWNTKLRIDDDELDVFYGLGLILEEKHNRYAEKRNQSGFSIGARSPFGVQYIYRTAPIRVFFEIAPTLRFIGHSGTDVDISIGVRYFL